uniref:Uncharacterized protein n=1 Tax=Anguilla anguilla TaxID=7936 RepID=A0A0E9WXT0_ANGAN
MLKWVSLAFRHEKRLAPNFLLNITNSIRLGHKIYMLITLIFKYVTNVIVILGFLC